MPFDSSLLEQSERVGNALRAADQTLACAESCTGGLLGGVITAIAGSSDYFDRSIVTYSNRAKQTELGVTREALDGPGAVSEDVGKQLAMGVRDTAQTDWGIGITGIAGPDGGTQAKPVGTVYIGIAYAGPWGSQRSTTRVERFSFDGDRQSIRTQSVRAALDLLEEELDSTQ